MAAAAVFQDEEYELGEEPLADPELIRDSMLKSISERQIWRPEPELIEDPIIVQQAREDLPTTDSMRPSLFTRYAFHYPDDDGGWARFTFKGRRHMKRIYDSPAKRMLLFCGRQVEKSTLLGNISLTYMSMIPGYRVLYVSPSATQTKTFSNDRIKEPIETSTVLSKFTTKMLSSNILEKQFVNRSKITMRYAFLNADRTRGIPAWMLQMDEFQDILSDNIPVIEQCLSHAPERWKRFIYSGTPKSLDNPLEYYRANMSTQGEWVVPCDDCGSNAKGAAGRYWNVLGEKNIGKKGLICEKCGNLLNSMAPDAQWANMVYEAPFEAYRIPQLMVPWKNWDEILLDYERYSRNKFYNEVLGISFDSGYRPLTTAQVQACCNPDLMMVDYESYVSRSAGYPVFMGIDWGTAEHSFTVVTLATYVDMKFRIFYAHRFTGREAEPAVQLDMICNLIDMFNVRAVGTDYGGGFDRNDFLVRKYGNERIWKFQYMARCQKKVEWDGKLGRFKVHRTEVMSDLFNAVKRGGVFEFPRWQEWKEPFAQDMLNIFSEYNEQLRMIQYKHSLDMPDDTLHSLVYALLGSMLIQPRPDIIIPKKTDKNTVMYPDYTAPVYQG